MKKIAPQRLVFKTYFFVVLFFSILFIQKPSFSQTNDLSAIDIAYEKIVLDNGLTVIVHEDHKAPIVAVNVWYHVGSKNEKVGKTGFAHLFEHLMFNGSENYNDDYFKPFQKIGATDMNGTTNNDRTNYFENIPVSSFDLALWMESDRMGHLIGALDSAKLEEQRGVVQNEKRQGDNEPYSQVNELMSKNCYPAGHPYSWTVIGSMEDLDAATLEDVHEWFESYYGAANAVLCIAGDVETNAAIEKVKQYFGDIPSGPPVSKHESYIAKREGVVRQITQDRVPQARIYKVWNTPGWGTPCADMLNLVSDVLATGKNSRLYKRLVYEDQIATNVSAYIYPREIGGQFRVIATAKPGEDLSTVEAVIDEELQKFFAEGPTQDELKLVKTQYMARFIRGIERIGGFGGKSDILAMNEVYGGSPDFYKTTIERINNATAEDLHKVANDWLTDGEYILEVHPFPEYKTGESVVDRSSLPESLTAPAPVFPDIQKHTLSNGLQVILAERHAVPIVSFELMVDAGFAAEQNFPAGTANLTLNMLDEGTESRDALTINKELNMLGATISSGSDLDVSYVLLSALKENLGKSLEIYADVLLNPSFPENEFDRLQKQQLATIQQEMATPIGMAVRLLPQYLYGKDHAYGRSFTGSGTAESVAAITPAVLAKFHDTWFKPNNSTLVVTGDVSMNEIIPLLENQFDNWKKGNTHKNTIAVLPQKEKSSIYLIDKPDSPQSFILAGNLSPSRADNDYLGIKMLNMVMGGQFTSRLNMNLREGKHWSYGVRSLILDARAQSPFIVVAPIQGDKTAEAVLEIKRELSDAANSKPVTNTELNNVKQNEILSLPGSWETVQSVGFSLEEMIKYGLPENYFSEYPDKIKNLDLNDIENAQKKVLFPDQMVWMIVGDRSKIETSLNELGMGPVSVIDVEGNLVQ
ncbi:pitrilysin family protein [uncultured Draconibacterium sp.]|uniref:M16 family metallopeptidase n=1 Tax=uncultured Draconibacterium sp. TaxID=1573823 RepID=UPI0025F388E6|nr:pitrilysin family protein [uncultured Draconibacterium sp.]